MSDKRKSIIALCLFFTAAFSVFTEEVDSAAPGIRYRIMTGGGVALPGFTMVTTYPGQSLDPGTDGSWGVFAGVEYPLNRAFSLEAEVGYYRTGTHFSIITSSSVSEFSYLNYDIVFLLGASWRPQSLSFYRFQPLFALGVSGALPTQDNHSTDPTGAALEGKFSLGSALRAGLEYSLKRGHHLGALFEYRQSLTNHYDSQEVNVKNSSYNFNIFYSIQLGQGS